MAGSSTLASFFSRLFGRAWRNGHDRAARRPTTVSALGYDRSLSLLPLDGYGPWSGSMAAVSRQDMVSRSRYFELHSALANRIAKLFADYVAGPRGIICSPASADDRWNRLATEIWQRAQRNLVLGPLGLHGWGAAQSALVWRWFFDGEVFLLLTQRPDTGDPAVQVLETQRIRSPAKPGIAAGRKETEGVEYDPATGDITAYFVSTPDGNTTRIGAASIIHLMDAGRADQYRGIPILAPALDDLHRLRDLERYEMLAHVDSAEKSMIFKLRTGEFDADEARRAALGLIDTDSDLGDVRERLKLYAQSLGGRAVAIFPDEDAIVVKPDRPTQEQRAFWDYLINKVCIAVGVPRQLVAPYSVQGTVARADLGAARNSLVSMSDIMLSCVQRVYEYSMSMIVSRDARLRSMAPPDYLAVSLRPPRQIDVDLGRSTAAMIEELKAGATHWDAIYGANGHDWREELRKRADQVAYMVTLARERGLDPSWLSNIIHDGGPSDPGQQPTEEVDDERD